MTTESITHDHQALFVIINEAATESAEPSQDKTAWVMACQMGDNI